MSYVCSDGHIKLSSDGKCLHCLRYVNDQAGTNISLESQKPSAVEETVGVPVSEQSSSMTEVSASFLLDITGPSLAQLDAFLALVREAYLTLRFNHPEETTLTVSLSTPSTTV